MRMIDGDEVLNIIAKYCPDDDGSCSCAEKDLRELLDEIEAMPTVEAENTDKTAVFQPFDKSDFDYLAERGMPIFKCFCSECGDMCFGDENFCSGCGARMEGDKS